ncbi:hypothetical protein [Nocardia concava]|uniref:hypothetical protein n=1 Tax=Nocardia concava TaxID=257281 RepID=UPI00031A4BF9|nr:hypothetical protein [Nocardia concava]
MNRRILTLAPLVPIVALLSAIWLPFVNTARLWLGMPALFVWLSAWVLLITPALLLAERGRTETEDRP